MTDRNDDRSLSLHAGPIGLRDAVDLWGPDLADWPDLVQLRHAREALLSDRGFRAYRDGAAAADRLLATAAGALDERIAARGSTARIAEGVLARVEPRRSRSYPRYAALAAVIVVAGFLGGASGWLVDVGGGSGGQSVVQLDPLLFGPAELSF